MSFCSASAATMYLYLAGNNKLLTDTRLGDKDVEVLCEALKSNLYISTLDLRYNNITDKGAEHIGKLLKVKMCKTVSLSIDAAAMACS